IGQIAEARAKLLERREAATAAAGGDVIAGWNKELMNLSVDLAECQARAKAINARLDRFSNAGEFISTYDQNQQELTALNKQIDEVAKRMMDMEGDVRLQRLDFIVTGTNEVPASATQPAEH